MKTEYLKELGLTDEQIQKVMAENGKDVEVQKAKTAAKESELATANQTITDLQDTVKKFDGVDVDGLKRAAADWETKYNADMSALKLDAALESALLAGRAKNTKAVKALLDTSVIKLDGDKLLGLDEQLMRLKGEADYLFGDQQTAGDGGGARINSAAEHGAPPDGGLDAFVAAAYKGAGISPTQNNGG